MDPITTRDGAPVVAVAIEGITIIWIGTKPTLPPGPGELAGDGSGMSRSIIARAKALWGDPIEADHPSWKQPVWTVPGHPVGVLATLLHIANGRGVVLQAPDDALEDLFMGGTIEDDTFDGPGTGAGEGDA